MKTLLVTGSSGLIGSEVCAYFARELGYTVHGIDNNQRAVFFGPAGDTRWNQQRLQRELPAFVHHELDIRDRDGVRALVDVAAPAAPSSMPPRSRATIAPRPFPFDDFDTNAIGTLNLLEAARQACPESPFVHMSTNKVYGDAPNQIPLAELDDALGLCRSGVRERHSRDLHDRSVEALAVRRIEGRGRRDGAGVRPLFRHADVLPARRLPHRARTIRASSCTASCSYLVKCNLEGRQYTVFGYKGKQVRDNIHSLDVARFIARLHRRRREPARSTTSAAARPIRARFSRRSRSPSALPAGSSATPTSIRIASAITSATTPTCARCARTIPRGTSPSRSRPPSRRSSTRGRRGRSRPR